MRRMLSLCLLFLLLPMASAIEAFPEKIEAGAEERTLIVRNNLGATASYTLESEGIEASMASFTLRAGETEKILIMVKSPKPSLRIIEKINDEQNVFNSVEINITAKDFKRDHKKFLFFLISLPILAFLAYILDKRNAYIYRNMIKKE